MLLTIIFLVVGASMAAFAYSALRLARADHGSEVASTLITLAEDIGYRARSGFGPDWGICRQELETIYEGEDDQLRLNASASLALGLGGTIVSLWLALQSANTSEPGTILTTLGHSLFSSGLGVATSLAISVILLPLARRRQERTIATSLARLREIARNHPPISQLSSTIREELAELRSGIGREFSSALSTAVTNFPEMMTDFGQRASSLAEIAERQGTAMIQVVDQIQACTTVVASATHSLGPVAADLAQSAKNIESIPERLSATLGEMRSVWIEEQRRQHAQALAEIADLQKTISDEAARREVRMEGVVSQLRDSVDEIQGELRQIPNILAGEIRAVSGSLGKEFGHEAKQHVSELSSRIVGENRELVDRIEKHDQAWRAGIGQIVAEIMDKVGVGFEERLYKDLEQLHSHLATTSNTLRDNVLETKAAVAAWETVIPGLNKAADRLALGDANLAKASTTLDRSAGNLEKVATATESLERSLAAALSAALQPYLEAFNRHQDRSEKAGASLDRVLAQQAGFLRNAINSLVRTGDSRSDA